MVEMYKNLTYNWKKTSLGKHSNSTTENVKILQEKCSNFTRNSCFTTLDKTIIWRIIKSMFVTNGQM